MDWEVITVYIILIAAVVLFITDRVRTDIVGLLIISILGLLETNGSAARISHDVLINGSLLLFEL